MRITKKTLIVCFTLTCVLLQAQTISNQTTPRLIKGKASEVGLSEVRLARIDSMCLEAIEKGHLPGMVALVSRHGKIVYHKAFGIANAVTKKSFKKMIFLDLLHNLKQLQQLRL